MNRNIFLGIMIPFLGTTAGAACVFLLKEELKANIQKVLLGFAAGVMVAATIWSLLIPAMELSKDMERLAFIPATVGFFIGIFFLLGMDHIIPHIHLDQEKPEGIKGNWKKSTMMILAITLHNIPEGAAVGIVLAGSKENSTVITMTAAITLSVGIAIQNFPEGAIVSLPLKEEVGRWKSFWYGTLSGAVEPVAAMITILLSDYISVVLPYLLAFAAGAMIYVVIEELIPESCAGEHSDRGTLGFSMGFVLMMILDVALG